MADVQTGRLCPGSTVYVSRFAAWSPGLTNSAEWGEWVSGKRAFTMSGESPALDFAESRWLRLNPKEMALFKRRLSQISRMTIQVLHEIMPLGEAAKMVFVSFRGEIQQQFKINRMLVEEGALSPAAFSQSVFNTPPAIASIALGLRAGYSAIYPGNGRFDDGVLAAAAPLLAGRAKEAALVYADELCPAEYHAPQCPPLAFAALMSAAGPGIPVALNGGSAEAGCLASPVDFLKMLCTGGEQT